MIISAILIAFRMARKKKSRSFSNPFSDLKEETIRNVFAIILLVLAVFLSLAAVGFAGVVGEWSMAGLKFVVGIGYYLLPILGFIFSFSLFKAADEERSLGVAKMIGAGLLLLSSLALAELFRDGAGGLLGSLLASPLVTLLDVVVATIFLLAMAVIAALIILDTYIHFDIAALFKKKPKEESEDPVTVGGLEEEGEGEEAEVEETTEDEEDDTEEVDDEEEADQKGSKLGSMLGLGKKAKKEPAPEPSMIVAPSLEEYTPPPLSVLARDKGKPQVGDTKANANIIKRTLHNFGIRVEMDEITVGPSVTRYALKPAEGVRVSKIVSLQSNLELALAASPIRIEAPIPGKSLVGIEVPNQKKATVSLYSLLSDALFTDNPKPLLASLGRDITGHPHYVDIAKMPHGMIAGTTGAGKSATLHSVITSLLYRNSPQKLRFIMVDPKRVELTLYNDIPHLLTPVITQPKQAILALKWAAKEMDRRYDILQAEKVRDIGSYHENVLAPAMKEFERKSRKIEDESELYDLKQELPEAMPYIVVVIDEMSDLMQAYPRELESVIVRLAQMSRAVGIHLILATQRPEVKVITGLIKANVPFRIALKVNSQIDSRTILDTPGAEKLLGQGDLLYISGESSKPRRLQSAFISEDELKKVTSFLGKHNDMGLETGIDLTDAGTGSDNLYAGDLDDDDDDPKYHEAKRTVIEAGKASTSFIQRKLGVGYARAARLMDMLEERGIIGPQDGSKPRDVLAGPDDDDSEDSDDDEEADDQNDEPDDEETDDDEEYDEDADEDGDDDEELDDEDNDRTRP